MLMFAFTQTFCAFGPSPMFASPVIRVSTIPFTVTVVDACTTEVPVTAEVITTSQEPVPPDVVQFCDPGVPGPETIVTVQVVPSGAFTGPLPLSTLMWQCKVWFVPTSFVAVGGVSWMFASTTCNGSHGPSDGKYVA